ncbi:elongation factor TS-domain-containing protein [Phlyctochytrium arcticum]|nr:elongation factor TS-domain-containing protein [Phlyctochytrium arcticum]
MAIITRFPSALLLRNSTRLRSVHWAISRPAIATILRTFTTTLPTRASAATMIAKLRKETQCKWDAATAGAKKAAKLGSRVAAEGLLGPCQSGNNAALVEFNSETDFVARSKEFVDLVQGTAFTASVMGQDVVEDTPGYFTALSAIEINSLLECSLMPDPAAPELPAAGLHGKTVKESILEAIGKLGENIRMPRALVTNAPLEDFEDSFLFAGGYVHSADSTLPSGVGRLGSLVVLRRAFVEEGEKFTESERAEFTSLAKKLAQHNPSFSPDFINDRDLDFCIKKEFFYYIPCNEGESEDEFRVGSS